GAAAGSGRPGDPGMIGVLVQSHLAVITGQRPQVVEAVARGRHDGVVAEGNEHRIAVLDQKQLIETTLRWVDPLDSKTTLGLEAVGISLLEPRLLRRAVLVMLMRRIARPGARRVVGLPHQKALSRSRGIEDGLHLALPGAFSAGLPGHLLRADPVGFTARLGGRADHRHLDAIPRADLDPRTRRQVYGRGGAGEDVRPAAQRPPAGPSKHGQVASAAQPYHQRLAGLEVGDAGSTRRQCPDLQPQPLGDGAAGAQQPPALLTIGRFGVEAQAAPHVCGSPVRRTWPQRVEASERKKRLGATAPAQSMPWTRTPLTRTPRDDQPAARLRTS